MAKLMGIGKKNWRRKEHFGQKRTGANTIELDLVKKKRREEEHEEKRKRIGDAAWGLGLKNGMDMTSSEDREMITDVFTTVS